MKKGRNKWIGKTVKDGLLEGLTAAVLGWLLEKVKGWLASRAASGFEGSFSFHGEDPGTKQS